MFCYCFGSFAVSTYLTNFYSYCVVFVVLCCCSLLSLFCNWEASLVQVHEWQLSSATWDLLCKCFILIAFSKHRCLLFFCTGQNTCLFCTISCIACGAFLTVPPMYIAIVPKRELKWGATTVIYMTCFFHMLLFILAFQVIAFLLSCLCGSCPCLQVCMLHEDIPWSNLFFSSSQTSLPCGADNQHHHSFSVLWVVRQHPMLSHVLRNFVLKTCSPKSALLVNLGLF